jgi:tetratricopeptide (TPR) repeat protein
MPLSAALFPAILSLAILIPGRGPSPAVSPTASGSRTNEKIETECKPPFRSAVEDGILVVQVLDLKDQLISGIHLDILGDGSSGVTADDGQVRLQLPSGTSPGQKVEIQLMAASREEWTFISPYNRRVVVPDPDDPSDRFVTVYVSPPGAKELLTSARAREALAAQAVAELPQRQRLDASRGGGSGRHTEEERRETLDRIARRYGLKAEDIDRAIREWRPEGLREKGIAALYEKKFGRAESHLAAALDAEIRRAAETAFFLGNAQYGAEKYSRAVASYSRAIELDPEVASAYYNRGLAHAELGDYDEAISNYTRAIDLDPEDASAYYNRGVVHAELGDYDEAISNYTRAIELDPEVAFAYYNRGLAHADLGDYDAALEDFARAIDLDPEYASAYYNLGVVHGRIGDYDAAISNYTRAIELDPEYASAYYNLGVVHGRIGDYDAAISNYTRAIELDPEDASAYCNRGVVHAILGDYDEAINNYTRAIELDSAFVDAYRMRSIVYRHIGNHQQAAADSVRASEL